MGSSAREFHLGVGRGSPARALLALAVAFGCGACSHVTLIKSTPPGAAVSIDGEVKGVTPLFYEEATGFGRSYHVRLTLDGYQTEAVELEQRMWWHSCLWPSICLMPFTFGLSGVGLLFARSLEDEYHFLLRPIPQPVTQAPPAAAAPATTRPAEGSSLPAP